MDSNNESKEKKVCLCIPTHNASATIRDTLDSLLSQTFKNISISVVDNASSDNTCEIVALYALSNPSITLLKFSENIGGNGNFNRCIQLATGDYTGIFHADDVYEPKMVEKQVAFLESHQDAGAVLVRARLIDAENNDMGLTSLPPELADLGACNRTYDFKEIFRYVLRDHNFLVCPSALVRTQVYQEHVRVWDGEKFRSSADLAVWLKILEKYRIGILPEPLMKYRLSSSQWTSVYQYLNVDKDDFFLVTDYYLRALPAGVSITNREKRNLKFLYLRDNCKRTVNCLISGNYGKARDLTREMCSFQMLITALRTKPRKLANHYRLFFWAYGISLYLLSRLPCFPWVSRIIARLKYGKTGLKPNVDVKNNNG